MADDKWASARELEDIIVAMPQINYRFDCNNWPGTDEPLMPESDRNAAISWLHRVNMKRGEILEARKA
jgi:hypothetical protein